MTPQEPRPPLRWSAGISAASLALLLAAACSSRAPTDVAGSALTGSWGSADALLTADRGGATLRIPCATVQFPTVTLDDSLGFSVTGVITQSAAFASPGDPYTLSGRLLGDRVVIPYQPLIPGASEDTLRPGADSADLACDDTVLDLQNTAIPPTVQLTAALGGDSLVYIVFHNVAAVPETLYYGGCAVAARIWTGPSFTHLAWQSGPTVNSVCPLFIAQLAIPANDSALMVAAVLVAMPYPYIGPPPSYGDVRAYINANGHVLELDAGIRNVPAVQ